MCTANAYLHRPDASEAFQSQIHNTFNAFLAVAAILINNELSEMYTLKEKDTRSNILFHQGSPESQGGPKRNSVGNAALPAMTIFVKPTVQSIVHGSGCHGIPASYHVHHKKWGLRLI